MYDFSVAIRILERKNEDKDKKTLAEYYSKFFIRSNDSSDYAGVQHFELGQLEEALAHYDLAIKNDRGSDKAGTYYYNRGLVKSRLDKVKGAIDDYNKATEHL